MTYTIFLEAKNERPKSLRYLCYPLHRTCLCHASHPTNSSYYSLYTSHSLVDVIHANFPKVIIVR